MSVESEPDFRANVFDARDRFQSTRPIGPGGLQSGSGGGTYDGMETRVTRLETHFEYVRRDLDEIKQGQAQIRADLQALTRSVTDLSTNLPTKNDLWAWKLQWAAIAVAAIALIVGGVIGGLAWIRPESQPTVITFPTDPRSPPAGP